MLDSKTLVCLGNPNRGDDAFGWALADRMIEREDLQFSVLKSSGDLTELLEIFETNREVLIVDAMETKEEVDIKLWDAVDQNIPSFLSGASSHVLGLSQAIELARALDRLPQRLLVIGVKARQFLIGSGLSESMSLLLPRVESLVYREFEIDFDKYMKSKEKLNSSIEEEGVRHA